MHIDYGTYHRECDQSSLAPQPVEKRLTESHWYQYGYADESASGVIKVVAEEDMLITQEYQPITATLERLKHGMNKSD